MTPKRTFGRKSKRREEILEESEKRKKNRTSGMFIYGKLARKLWNQGKTVEDIARELFISEERVIQLIK